MQIRMMLSASLKGVVAQTLCKKAEEGALRRAGDPPRQCRGLEPHPRGQELPDPVDHDLRNLGMVGLNDALLELVRAKKVEPREAYLKSIDKANLIAAFKTANIPLPGEAEV